MENTALLRKNNTLHLSVMLSQSYQTGGDREIHSPDQINKFSGKSGTALLLLLLFFQFPVLSSQGREGRGGKWPPEIEKRFLLSLSLPTEKWCPHSLYLQCILLQDVAKKKNPDFASFGSLYVGTRKREVNSNARTKFGSKFLMEHPVCLWISTSTMCVYVVRMCTVYLSLARCDPTEAPLLTQRQPQQWVICGARGRSITTDGGGRSRSLGRGEGRVCLSRRLIQQKFGTKHV